MTRALKKPTGAILEEYITTSYHYFNNGIFQYHNQDSDYGTYTGRFCFQYSNGKTTKWYTKTNSPKWLYSLWLMALEER